MPRIHGSKCSVKVIAVPDGRLNALRSSCGILLAQAPRWSTGPGRTTVIRTSSQRCGIYSITNSIINNIIIINIIIVAA